MAAVLSCRDGAAMCATVVRVTWRAASERQIEALIDQLDAMDDDADTEDDSTAEPSRGWSLTFAGGAGDDWEGTSPEWYGGAA